MDSSKDERVAKQIAKTSDSIHKKYCALKISKIEEDIVLERHFQPIVESLKQMIENIANKNLSRLRKK